MGAGAVGGAGTARKRVERLNSTSSFMEPMARKKIGKHNSNMKVTSTDVKSSTRDQNSKDIVPDKKRVAKRMQSLINVNISAVDKDDKHTTTEKKRGGPKSSNTQLLMGEDI